MRALLLFTALIFSSTAFAGADDQCLKSSARTTPCPNLLWKAQQVEDLNGNKRNKLVCICLKDFEALFQVPTDDNEKIRLNMQIRQIEADTNMTKAELIKLIKQ